MCERVRRDLPPGRHEPPHLSGAKSVGRVQRGDLEVDHRRPAQPPEERKRVAVDARIAVVEGENDGPRRELSAPAPSRHETRHSNRAKTVSPQPVDDHRELRRIEVEGRVASARRRIAHFVEPEQRNSCRRRRGRASTIAAGADVRAVPVVSGEHGVAPRVACPSETLARGAVPAPAPRRCQRAERGHRHQRERARLRGKRSRARSSEAVEQRHPSGHASAIQREKWEPRRH